MNPLSSVERDLLASLRICEVNEPRLNGEFSKIPHQGRRVLVPKRLADRFIAVSEHGGNILSIQVKSTAVRLARAKLGMRYRPKVLPELAPKIYSCSTFVFWMMAFVGIHMPRYAIDQSYVGKKLNGPGRPGLAFYKNAFPVEDEDRAIGHVGFTTPEGTIIHGSRAHDKIVEEAIPGGAVLYTNPFPTVPSRLIIIPKKIRGVQTALDVARWLARPLT